MVPSHNSELLTRIVILLTLSVPLAGCSPAGTTTSEPSKMSPGEKGTAKTAVTTSSSQRSAQPKPELRPFDKNADQEMRELFGVIREQRDEAHVKVANQFWLIRAKVSHVDENQAVIKIDGIDQLAVLYFRDKSEWKKVVSGEENLFEAAVDDWVSRTFYKGFVSSSN